MIGLWLWFFCLCAIVFLIMLVLLVRCGCVGFVFVLLFVFFAVFVVYCCSERLVLIVLDIASFGGLRLLVAYCLVLVMFVC